MIKVIIGDNAVGKTVYLEDFIKAHFGNECVTNIRRLQYPGFENAVIDKRKVNILQGIMEVTELTISKLNDAIAVTGAFYGDFEYGGNFMDIATIISKKGKYLCLDEPELGIGYTEECALAGYLLAVSELFDDVVIVTHSHIIMSQFPDFLYTIEDKELRKVDVTYANENFI